MSQEIVSEARQLGKKEQGSALKEDGNTLAEDGGTPQLNNGNTSQEDIVITPEIALHLGLPPLEPLDLSRENILESWRKFKQKYANSEFAIGINTKESATRVATLVTVIANNAINVFNTSNTYMECRR